VRGRHLHRCKTKLDLHQDHLDLLDKVSIFLHPQVAKMVESYHHLEVLICLLHLEEIKEYHHRLECNSKTQ